VTNTSKSNLPPRSPTPPIKLIDIRPRSFSQRRLIALLAAVSLAATLGFLFWESPNVVFDPLLNTSADLSNLFNQNPGNELGAGDFLDLRDPACTKSFSLRIARRVFMQMSHNCEYSIHVESGQARVNFLNSTKGTIDIGPGRVWSASDFWSIRPLTAEAGVRLEPAS
jgi:hypothetical protein